MKKTKDTIPASGLTVLFEPDDARHAVIDILFVSGLGGHPVRTWQHSKPATSLTPQTPNGNPYGNNTLPRRKGSLRELVRKNSHSLKRCLSNASLSRDTRDAAAKKTDEDDKETVRPPLPMTLPTPRQRRVLRKNNYLRNNGNGSSSSNNYLGFPSTTRSESKLLLLLGSSARGTVSDINTAAKEAPVPRRSKSTSRLRLLRAPEEDRQQEQPKQPDEVDEATSVYWPLDLLPSSCPNTRIITWGCQTLSTKGRLLPAQNNIFDHAEDLLRELATLRKDSKTFGRALVVVTHSLGGVIVKELLCRAEASDDYSRKDVLQSLAGIAFLGSPHRDSQYGTLTEAVKHLAGLSLGVSPQDAVLQDLCGANTPTLESGRRNFVRLWNDYNFRVRTFHEADKSHNSAISQNEQQKTLRREAACLGDPRERCEAIDANHLDLGRCFRSADDPVYRSLSFWLLRFIHDEIHRLRDLTPREEAVLRALAAKPSKARMPQGIIPSMAGLRDSYPGTGLWLYDLPSFQAWHQRASGGRNRILWLKGRPGSGKSVLLKSLRGRVERQWGPLNSNVVWSLAEGETLNSVFFPGQPRPPQHHMGSPAGVYRSLLSQLYYQDPRLRKALEAVCKRSSTSSFASISLDDAQVVTFFVDDYVDQKIETPTRRTFIFVDATDDCGLPYLQDLLYYLSQLAANSDYSICVATASHPEVVLDNAIEVVLHQQNVDDILRYVSLHLMAEWEDRNFTVMRIGSKAAGCFLWAEIVVSILNAAIEEGATEELIEEAVAEMPGDIDGLYEWLFGTLGPEEKTETLILMQWVLFSPEPLRLNDLRFAIQVSQGLNQGRGPFTDPYAALHVGPPTSIRDLRRPSRIEGGAFDSPSQFYSWVRSRSIGLLELQPQTPSHAHSRSHSRSHSHSRSLSGGGTIHEPQGLRRVRFIHESVRNFFLSGRGFICLTQTQPQSLPPSPSLGRNPSPGPVLPSVTTSKPTVDDFADNAHYSLLQACLAYLNVIELEPLGRQVASGKVEMSGVSGAAADQRRLVVSSYPFLEYAVDHLVFHLLSPRLFRYYLPQTELLRALAANQCRLWRRWTALLGCSCTDADAVMAKVAAGSAHDLLGPVFGTRYRLERIFRTLARLAGQGAFGGSIDKAGSAPNASNAPNTVNTANATNIALQQTTISSAALRAHASSLPRLKTRPPLSSSRCFSRIPQPQSASRSARSSPPPPPPLSATSQMTQATLAESSLFSPHSPHSPTSPGTPLSFMSPVSIGPAPGTDPALWSPIYVK
ncbi:hypothetical protein SBRCBS47491_000722 [Sporothrix bragantina]|uniref:Nephrocystin 3-like N-terminal domain-containing protein n=1 Tax=Sporothrix bragantina TaxID=671064 RepID=A0ABP0ASY9_9PEZI